MSLFQPLKIGNVTLQNRVVLAPLTRLRASDDHVPLPMVAEYYAQRGSTPGTLLITEGVFISPEAGGMTNVPGIWNQAQIDAWKVVTDAVHEKKSFIFLQLWALGRAAEEPILKEKLGSDARVVSASDIPIEQSKSISAYVSGTTVPTPLTEEEIQAYIKNYAQAAKNAIAAGFDGVEIHGANGYLIDQFIQDVSNKRTDQWGGSIEKRAKFGLEVAKAVVEAVGAERTGIRMSPFSTFQDMKMDDPKPQFSYYTQELKKLSLAYIHIVEGRGIGGLPTPPPGEEIDFLLDIWGNSPALLASGFSPETAIKRSDDETARGRNVAIVFGRHFISNPDLPYRIQNGIPLTPYDRNTFYYKMQETGYTTYPFSKEFEARL
ncbi:hypothetical protein HYFRA_00004861 [Hymenoscyphus fraxineus]|uniref:NADH:flavin oxidoreductase/NADH oxidase N-terminal domain-containing protein n=1 Tax=Hymenoscyphus fraxineus TaxID=746836 RepID=A0A9N9PJZ4_9HELO|nr:hypothetical protein HYFRA_00004861 [Hymenoscyphus fraxineus]